MQCQRRLSRPEQLYAAWLRGHVLHRWLREDATMRALQASDLPCHTVP